MVTQIYWHSASGAFEFQLLRKYWICYLHCLGTTKLTAHLGSLIQHRNQNKDVTHPRLVRTL